MTEPVDQLEQVAQELLNEAEKETDPVKRERLLYLAQEYRSRAEQARRGLVVELPPEIEPKQQVQSLSQQSLRVDVPGGLLKA